MDQKDAKKVVLDALQGAQTGVSVHGQLDLQLRLNKALHELAAHGFYVTDDKLGVVVGIDVEIVNRQYQMMPVYRMPE